MRLMIVSNRLPVVIEQNEDGWTMRSGSGGLVSALGPALRRAGGVWIGWAGTGAADEAELNRVLAEHAQLTGFEMNAVPMSQAEVEGFYQGFCNEIIWPLFHDLQTHCNFNPDYWTHYLNVRQTFADVVCRQLQDDDFVWIHDYHLLDLGRRLREMGVANRMGFFLHIPFPPPDIFAKLPWRKEILEGLLYYDLVGFQTPRDLENFMDCIRKLLPHVRRSRRRGVIRCANGDCQADVGHFPIGIDYEHFATYAASAAVTEGVEQLRRELPGRQIILGIDRLDYTKGIPDRLRAFQLALKRYPDLHRKVTLLQVVIPSREAVPEYQELKSKVEQLVAQTNGEFTQPGWVPIHYVFRSLDWTDLLAYYRTADVALVTPLKDGMNLIAKEYCACQIDGDGVLILSEFAGSAAQLRRGAVLVNPYDQEGVALAIRDSVLMSAEQRKPSMRRLRSVVRRQDVFWWVDEFLTACGVKDRPSARPKPARPTTPRATGASV